MPTTTKLGSALTSGVTSPKIVAAKAGALVAARFRLKQQHRSGISFRKRFGRVNCRRVIRVEPNAMPEHVSKHIHVGICGWTFAPWRGVFYPKGLPHAQELAYAARHLTAIEINGTFYRTQTPATFRKWAAEVPDGFVFSVKGHQR